MGGALRRSEAGRPGGRGRPARSTASHLLASLLLLLDTRPVGCRIHGPCAAPGPPAQSRPPSSCFGELMCACSPLSDSPQGSAPGAGRGPSKAGKCPAPSAADKQNRGEATRRDDGVLAAPPRTARTHAAVAMASDWAGTSVAMCMASRSYCGSRMHRDGRSTRPLPAVACGAFMAPFGSRRASSRAIGSWLPWPSAEKARGQYPPWAYCPKLPWWGAPVDRCAGEFVRIQPQCLDHSQVGL